MDAATFDRYVTERYAVLVGHVTAMCGNRDDAADAVQEALTRAWARRSMFGRHPDPDAWVRTVARHLLVDAWRRGRRQVPLDADPVHESPDTASKVALERALRELPDHQRHAVVLYYLVDRSVEDIATELGATAGSVRVWLSRARKHLGVLLSDDKEIHHA